MMTASSGNKLPPFEDIVKHLEKYVKSNEEDLAKNASLSPNIEPKYLCEVIADTIERIHRRKTKATWTRWMILRIIFTTK